MRGRGRCGTLEAENCATAGKEEDMMEFLLNSQTERCRMEVYSEYLRKLPELLKQLETVEKMYEKAEMESRMLRDKDPADHSVALYAERLQRTKEQCRVRAEDIRQQCRLIFALKARIERESAGLQALME